MDKIELIYLVPVIFPIICLRSFNVKAYREKTKKFLWRNDQ